MQTDRGHDEDSAVASGSQVHIWSSLRDTMNPGGVHPFRVPPVYWGYKRHLIWTRILHQLQSFSSFLLQVIQLLMAETNILQSIFWYTWQWQWMLTTSRHDSMRDLHIFHHNKTYWTWCQGHNEKLLVNCITILYTILQKHKEMWPFLTHVAIPTF
jgi:hypothetical protein